MNTYIYALTEPNKDISPGNIRYIGKTSANPSKRLNRHIFDSVHFNNNDHKSNWINCLIHNGMRPDISVLCSVMNDNDWADVEREVIAQYKKLGSDLTNATDGGEGSFSVSKETRMKLRLANLGNKYCLGHRHTEESIKKMSLAKIGNKGPMGYKRTEEEKRAISVRMFGNKHSLGHQNALGKKKKLSGGLNGQI